MFERIKARRVRYLVEARQQQILLDMLNEDRFKKRLEDPDESEWQSLGKPSDKTLTEQESEHLRDQAIRFYYRNPHARNIIRLFEKYIVGRGFQITPEADDPKIKAYWEEFWRINKMALKKKEIVRRTMRDGESFRRYFVKERMLIMRFMNPAKVKEPDTKEANGVVGNASHGIETKRDDIEEVLAYWYKGKRILAEDVQHNKILVDSDVKRGRSILEVFADYLAMYDRWLKDRMKLNMVRSIVALIKKVSGTPAQTANIVSAQDTTQRKAPDGTPYQKAPEGVSIFTTNKGVEYEMKSPNLQAGDVANDGRAIRLYISAGSGLPEFMVTSDSSNSSYSSTMVAEGPAVMEFEDWQDYFAEVFQEIYTKVIETGIVKNKIPARISVETEEVNIDPETGEVKTTTKKETIDTPTTAKIVFPELVARDILKETQALIQQNNQGWISGHTASARLDLTYDDEQKLIRQETDQFKTEDDEHDHGEGEFDQLRRDQTQTGGTE